VVDEVNKVDKVIEKPKITKLLEKRKCSSPLLSPSSNKVLVVSKPLWTFENKQAAQTLSQATTCHQNVALIPVNIGNMSDRYFIFCFIQVL